MLKSNSGLIAQRKIMVEKFRHQTTHVSANAKIIFGISYALSVCYLRHQIGCHMLEPTLAEAEIQTIIYTRWPMYYSAKKIN